MKYKYLVQVYFKNDVEFDELDNGKIINDEPLIKFLTNDFHYEEKLNVNEFGSRWLSTKVNFSYEYEYYSNELVQFMTHLANDNVVLLVSEISDSYIDSEVDLCINSAKPKFFSNLICNVFKHEDGVITYMGTIDSVNHIQSFNGNLGDEKEYKKYKEWILNKLKKLFS